MGALEAALANADAVPGAAEFLAQCLGKWTGQIEEGEGEGEEDGEEDAGEDGEEEEGEGAAAQGPPQPLLPDLPPFLTQEQLVCGLSQGITAMLGSAQAQAHTVGAVEEALSVLGEAELAAFRTEWYEPARGMYERGDRAGAAEHLLGSQVFGE